MKRFWSKVDRSGGPESCWLWTAGTDKDGYGKVRYAGRHRRAHQVSMILAGGLGEFVCHTCDNPACVNPAHLYDGDASSNMTDRAARGGLDQRGARNPNAKLSKEDVRQIRALREAGWKLREIAVEFGVCEATVCLVTKRQVWAHV